MQKIAPLRERGRHVAEIVVREDEGPAGKLLLWEVNFVDGSAIIFHEEGDDAYVAATRPDKDGLRPRPKEWSVFISGARRVLSGGDGSEIEWRSPLPQKARRTRGNRPVVIVGFDFGTHSTKVLFRKRNEEVAKTLPLAAPVPGYPKFAVPSLIRLVDGCLWFGEKAYHRSDGQLYPSLKVHLLGPEAEEHAMPFPPGPDPDLLVSCYLAWAFGRARQEIERLVPDADVRLNMAAPMDHLEECSVKMRFLQIVQAAWELSFGDFSTTIGQGALLADIEPLINGLRTCDVVDESERKFDVLPETIAPIVSLNKDPRTAPGMYMIFDVGAGTTEVSVNHSNEQNADHRVLCYYDQTCMIGGDRLARREKLDATEKETQASDLIDDLMKVARVTWATGYEKDAPNHAARPRWKQLTILLAGGGSRHPGVQAAFEKKSPLTDCFENYGVNHQVIWHAPKNIDLGKHADAEEDLPLLNVAFGLTHERETWPDVYEPDSIEPLAPTETIMRPDPFHYVGGK